MASPNLNKINQAMLDLRELINAELSKTVDGLECDLTLVVEVEQTALDELCAELTDHVLVVQESKFIQILFGDMALVIAAKENIQSSNEPE